MIAFLTLELMLHHSFSTNLPLWASKPGLATSERSSSYTPTHYVSQQSRLTIPEMSIQGGGDEDRRPPYNCLTPMDCLLCKLDKNNRSSCVDFC